MPPDYYTLLGIAPNATQRQIKMAYRQRMKQAHPDLAGAEHKAQREALAKQINEAYRVLSDPMQRRRYDRHHRTTTTSTRTSSSPDPLVLMIRGFFNALSFLFGRRS
jgi:DnaJ-class molecular chaperone